MLNDLNLELQGKDKAVINMISSLNAVKRKADSLASKISTLFRPNSSGVEGAVLTLQADMKSWARGLTHRGKAPRHEEMYFLLDCNFLFRSLMWVSLFPREDHWVKAPFHHDWWSLGNVLEAGCQQLSSGLCIPSWFHSVQVIKVNSGNDKNMYIVVLCATHTKHELHLVYLMLLYKVDKHTLYM